MTDPAAGYAAMEAVLRAWEQAHAKIKRNEKRAEAYRKFAAYKREAFERTYPRPWHKLLSIRLREMGIGLDGGRQSVPLPKVAKVTYKPGELPPRGNAIPWCRCGGIREGFNVRECAKCRGTY